MLPEALGFGKLGYEFHPPVKRLGNFVFRVNLRFGFTVKGNQNHLRLDATGDKVVLDPDRSPVGEVNVILLRPDPVSVADHIYFNWGVVSKILDNFA
jgi:hypothetical protein